MWRTVKSIAREWEEDRDYQNKNRDDNLSHSRGSENGDNKSNLRRIFEVESEKFEYPWDVP